MKRFQSAMYRSFLVGMLFLGLSLLVNPVQQELSKLASFEIWLNSSQHSTEEATSESISTHLLSTWSYFHDAQMSVNTPLPNVEISLSSIFVVIGGLFILFLYLTKPISKELLFGISNHLSISSSPLNLRYSLSPNAP